MFTRTGGARPDVEDMLIVFTDGTSHEPKQMEENAKILKDKGVRIIAIGAAQTVSEINMEEELLKIAPNKTDVILTSFDKLNDIVRDIIPRSNCWTTTPTPIPTSKLFYEV